MVARRHARPRQAAAKTRAVTAAPLLPRVVDQTMSLLAILAVVAVPLAVLPDFDNRFRLIKELILRAEAIAGLFLMSAAALLDGGKRFRQMLGRRDLVLLLGAINAWTLITALTSRNRLLSFESLVTVVLTTIVFVFVWYTAPRMTLLILDVLVPIAALNAVLATLQEYSIWNPFQFDAAAGHHLESTALIGNPNLVGSWMLISGVALTVGMLTLRGWRRYWHGAGALIAVGGILVSQTRTAVIAYGVTVVAIVVGRSWRRIGYAIAGVIMAFLVGLILNIPPVVKIAVLPWYAAHGRWDIALSSRMPAFLAAIEMIGDHPIVGVGPGGYKYNYMPYRIELRDKYSKALTRGAAANFGETHNDHLQLLAETGVPGYALFLTALVLLARRRMSAGDDEEEADDGTDPPRRAVARNLALPFAVMIAVLALAQFPLQVAVTRHLLVSLAALVVGWRELR